MDMWPTQIKFSFLSASSQLKLFHDTCVKCVLETQQSPMCKCQATLALGE